MGSEVLGIVEKRGGDWCLWWSPGEASLQLLLEFVVFRLWCASVRLFPTYTYFPTGKIQEVPTWLEATGLDKRRNRSLNSNTPKKTSRLCLWIDTSYFLKEVSGHWPISKNLCFPDHDCRWSFLNLSRYPFPAGDWIQTGTRWISEAINGHGRNEAVRRKRENLRNLNGPNQGTRVW